jgi:hypothetical protein
LRDGARCTHRFRCRVETRLQAGGAGALLPIVDRAARFASAVLVVGALACSGAPPSELLGGNPGVSDDGGPLADATLDSTVGAGLGADSGATSDASTPEVETQETSAPETGPPDTGVAPPPIDAGPGSVYCAVQGQSSFCLPPDFCCMLPNGGACEGIGSACGGTAVNCDDTADCPQGQVCCETGAGTAHAEVSCSPTCASALGTPGVQFCDPAAPDCPPAVPNCEPSLLPGYHACD